CTCGGQSASSRWPLLAAHPDSDGAVARSLERAVAGALVAWAHVVAMGADLDVDGVVDEPARAAAPVPEDAVGAAGPAADGVVVDLAGHRAVRRDGPDRLAGGTAAGHPR